MPDFIENEPSPAELPPLQNPERGEGQKQEARPEHPPVAVSEKISESIPPAVTSAPSVAVALTVTDPITASIETILSEDMYEHFKAMPPADQAKFKQKGEETVSKLSKLMNQTAIKAKEVLRLIAEWLRFIPHVNRYFLEQESKIKTDKILELHRMKHEE